MNIAGAPRDRVRGVRGHDHEVPRKVHQTREGFLDARRGTAHTARHWQQLAKVGSEAMASRCSERFFWGMLKTSSHTRTFESGTPAASLTDRTALDIDLYCTWFGSGCS